ncbi:DExH-box ATP-dependent RNA helicase DExH17-like [Rutidosis leptorrhynchoides]|uniref:DExH-box ATP-dependent RNA helicase DExH17-like n=1 Tax=Rutidosis leptorrhynchoides TaxID=125765 RepID=UPI003A99D8EC
MLLAKSLHQKLWEDSPYLLKQLPGIGMVTAKALQSMGVNTFETLAEADPRKIEMVTGRKFPFGNHIKDSLLSLPPKVDLKVEETTCPNYGKFKLVMTLTRLSQSSQATKRHYADVVVAVEEDNLIVFHEKIRVEEFTSPYSATVLVTCPLQGKLTVKANMIFEEYVGIDIHQKVILMRDNKLESYYKHATKKVFLPQPTDVCVIEPENDHSPTVPALRPDKSLNPKNEDASVQPNY